MPNDYKLYLRNRQKNLANSLFIFCLSLLIGALLIYFFPSPNPTFGGVNDPGRWLAAAAVSFALMAGMIGVPIYTVLLVVNFIRLKRFERSGFVPEKDINKCFEGEGLRIIKALVPGQGESPGEVWNNFSLPEHKTLEQINVSVEEKKKIYDSDLERDIIAVGKTIDEVENVLLSEWKLLLEQRDKMRL